MANIKSAKKRIRIGERNTVQNKTVRSDLKTALKKAHSALENNTDDKSDLVSEAVKRIDSAAGRGLIHRNNAAHKKSKLVVKLNRTN